MKIKDALKSFSPKNIPSVFLLKGNDHFLQDFFIKKVSKIYFNNLYNTTLMLPDDMGGKEIIEKLASSDLFEKYKLFIIREPQKILGRSSSDLLEICKNPNQGHLIFLISDEWNAKSNFFKKIESFIKPIDTQSPFEKDMVKWAKYLIKEKNKFADSKVLLNLVDTAGQSLVHLNNEINKLCLFVEPRTRIEIEDLDYFSGWSRERRLWEFLLAYSNKNYEKSAVIGKSLIEGGNQITSIIISITSLFQEMLFEKMKKSGTFRYKIGYIPLPSSIKKRIVYFTKNFSYKEIAHALYLLHEIDKRKKTQITDDEIELISFIGQTIGSK